MSEIWTPVAGYEGIYEVSDLGALRRVGGWSDGRKIPFARVLKQTRKNYMRIMLYREGAAKDFMVHRLVHVSFRGPMPPGTEINHINGDKHDNRLANLECITHSANQIHSYRSLGRYRHQGSGHPMAKLTDEQVLEIRSLYGTVVQRDIAAKFGVCKATVGLICNRKIWRHI